MLNNMLCARAGVWTISRASALCLLKYAWPLNAINAYLGSAVPASVMKSRANVGDYTHTRRSEDTAYKHDSHTQRRTSFSQRGAKSIPSTPHQFYLHGFDVKLRLSGGERFSLLCDARIRACTPTQMLTNDGNPLNTSGTRAHSCETQAIIACDLKGLHLFPSFISKQPAPAWNRHSVTLCGEGDGGSVSHLSNEM